MHRLAHLIVRVADAHTNRLMDQMLRAGLLEGIAHVPVGKWKMLSRGQGLLKAQAFFAEKGVALEPAWFDLADQGLYKSVLLKAKQITHSDEDADELAQDIAAGFTRSESVEGGQLYDVGRAVRSSGDLSLSHARGLMLKHTRQRAISLVQRRREESLTEDPAEEGGGGQKDVPTNVDRSQTVDDIISFLSSPRGGNLYKRIYDELAKIWPKRLGALAIFEQIVKNPDITDVDIAHILKPGIPDNTPGSWVQLGAATYVSKVRREIRTLIPEIIQNMPGLLRDVELQKELSGLGYGQGARFARFAKNLAIFLSRPVR
jgi:hypothetical protein